MQQALIDLATTLGQALLNRGWYCVTAESCTGGLVAAAITEVPGSSQWLDRGFVTYSNEAKQQMLKVTKDTLSQFGAVSEETAIAMVQGALAQSNAHVSVAITGIAGPTGGSVDKPVGLVWIAWANVDLIKTTRFLFRGDRQAVRVQATMAALEGLIEIT